MKSIFVILALLFSTAAYAQEAPKCSTVEQTVARNVETIKVIEQNEGIKVSGPVKVTGPNAQRIVEALTGQPVPVSLVITDLVVYKFGDNEVVVVVFVKGCEAGIMAGPPAEFEAALKKVQ